MASVHCPLSGDYMLTYYFRESQLPIDLILLVYIHKSIMHHVTVIDII